MELKEFVKVGLPDKALECGLSHPIDVVKADVILDQSDDLSDVAMRELETSTE
jgi:hypothetical protein